MADTSTKKEPEIRKEYEPSETESAVLKRVYERYYAMRDARSKFEPVWDKAIKNWEGSRGERVDWKSDIFIPLTSSVIESQMAEIIQQELKPWAVARGVEDEGKSYRSAFFSTGDAKLDLNAVHDYALKAENTIYRMKQDGIII